MTSINQNQYRIWNLFHPEKKPMIVTRSQFVKCYPQLRQKSVQMFEQITTVHKKFFQELVKYQCDKQMMFKKIVTLSEAEQTILLDFCVFCQQYSILELGRFAMKMHLQNMQIIKWLIKHLGQFSAKKLPSETNLSVRFKQKDNIKEIIENKKSVNYYRVKENSKFLAEGIDYELNVIQKQIQGERKNQLQQFENILKNKQFIERIEASQNQKILFQAVDIISHHSEVFRKLTKNNKQAFIDNYKDLNIKPYAKLKSEIDDAMKEKIQKANHQLINKLDNFLKARNAQVQEQKQIKFKQIGVQINLNEEKIQLEIKNKNQKIKELTVNLNYQKTRSQKLQNLLRQKTNHFQQKLIKIRFEKNKQTQLQILKKSTTQLTSIRNIQIQNNAKQLGKISEESSKVHIEHISQNSSSNKTKRTSKRYNRQESLYQKSLMRIQFNLPNQLPSSTPTSDYQQLSAINQCKLSICNEEVIYQYSPSLGVIQLMRRAREYSEGCQKKLKFQSNVINQHYKQSGLKYKERNQSLLTITNIRKMGREGTKNSISLNYKQNIELESSNKNIRGQRNSKEKSPFKSKFNEEIGRMNCTNQTLQNYDLNNQVDVCENDNKIKKMSESTSKMFPLSTDRYRFSNNFQVLNVDADLFIKNKGRVNQMMVQLKKKRRTREIVLKSQNYQNIEGRNSLNPEKLLKIYFNQENAMIAELEYGVSVAFLQKNVGEKSKCLNKNEEYIERMSKKLHKFLSNERKERRKYYLELQQMIKTPLSYIKGNVKKCTNSMLSKDDIINFVRFITILHESCEGKPCEHFQQFLCDIGMR